jgi:hypothetical protein
MGQDNSKNNKTKTKKLGFSVNTMDKEYILSSYNLKSNLSTLTSDNTIPLYLNQGIYKDDVKNLVLTLNDGKLSFKRKLQALGVQTETTSYFTFLYDFTKNEEMLIPMITSINPNQNFKFEVNKDGQLFMKLNTGGKKQVYHIGKEASTEEINKYKELNRSITTSVISSRLVPYLKDLAGWKVTDSNDKQKYFVVRGDEVNLYPKNPFLYPPTSSGKYDVRNWPYKFVTNFTPNFQGGAYGCGRTIGRCPNPKINIDGSQQCNAGIVYPPPAGYKITSGFWNNANQKTGGIPFLNLPDQKGVLVVDDPSLSDRAISWKDIWTESKNRKEITHPNCSSKTVPLGSMISSVGTVGNPGNLITDIFGCVNKEYVLTDNTYPYAQTLGGTAWHDKGCGANKSAICFLNSNDTVLSTYCVGPDARYDSSSRGGQQQMSNPKTNLGLDPYKLLTYEDTLRGCENTNQNLKDQKGIFPGSDKCTDVMIDHCIKQPQSDRCIRYLQNWIKSPSGTNTDLLNWLQTYCDNLTPEERLAGKNADLCGCYLSEEEYRAAKDKMLIALAQGDENLKNALAPLFEDLKKCWFPECLAESSIKKPGEKDQPCANRNFNFCIQKCEINNKGQMGNAACKNDATCSQIFNPPPTPAPTSTPTSSPSGPTPAPTMAPKQKMIIFAVGGISLIVLIIAVILVILSNKKTKTN